MPHAVSALRPAWAVPGARVSLEGIHLPVPADGPPHVLVGTHDALVVAASPTSVRIIVPAEARGSSAIRIDELPGETVYLEVAGPLVTGVHQVDSPAFDGQGRLYCTMSGSRGTRAPVPLYRVTRDGVREPIPVEIANPTALTWGPDGYLYVSSRFDGQVYRLGPDDHAELYATELGVATGLAFSGDGHLFVGDRSGTILQDFCRPARRSVCHDSFERRRFSPCLRAGRLSVCRRSHVVHARPDLSHHSRSAD